MVAVPEFVNNQPELPNEKGAEAFQNDAKLDSVNLDNLQDVAFSGMDNSSANALLGSVEIASTAGHPVVRDALARDAEIAKMTTTDECETGLSQEKIAVANLESRVSGTRNAMELAEDKQQADKMLEASTYFANFA